VDDYDATLNQTNIDGNNNKFYIIQVLKQDPSFYYTYTRWGRVGETGSNQMLGPFNSANEAIKQFKSKFKDKTKNDCMVKKKIFLFKIY
jgi:poly [ADP-ribose] polymerase